MNESITTQRLRSKNVVVIGGSKGVGRAIVAAAHAQGAQVLAVARKAEPLSKLADEFPGSDSFRFILSPGSQGLSGGSYSPRYGSGERACIRGR